MSHQRGFDEVMIVNPGGSAFSDAGAKRMRFHYGNDPTLGYYGAPGYGYYADPGYGYYADPYSGYYGEPVEGFGEHPVDGAYGWYGEPDYHGYAEPEYHGYGYEPVGYFAEEQPMAGYGTDFPMGAFSGAYGEPAQVDGYGNLIDGYGNVVDGYGNIVEGYDDYGDGYGVMPEMVGYGEPDPSVGGYAEDPSVAGYAEHDPSMGGYGEPDMHGYVRDVPSRFSAGCPMPTNVHGFGEPVEGYVRPSPVTPSCDALSQQPTSTTSVPETFKPLW